MTTKVMKVKYRNFKGLGFSTLECRVCGQASAVRYKNGKPNLVKCWQCKNGCKLNNEIQIDESKDDLDKLIDKYNKRDNFFNPPNCLSNLCYVIRQDKRPKTDYSKLEQDLLSECCVW